MTHVIHLSLHPIHLQHILGRIDSQATVCNLLDIVDCRDNGRVQNSCNGVSSMRE